MTEKSPLLCAKNIWKKFTYPNEMTILKGVDLTVHRGETVAITGPSGEGKSTLLHILGTLDSPSDGTIEIVGQDVSTFNKSRIRNQNIGFVFQSFHLLEDYTALENVLMPTRIGRKSFTKNSPSYLHGKQLLNRVGLSDRIDYSVKQLSGGEKQRVAIARAFCNDPDLIFADEPSGNLDHANSEIIHNLLIDFAKKENKGLIVVTHDQALASLTDKRYTLSGGLLTDTQPH